MHEIVQVYRRWTEMTDKFVEQKLMGLSGARPSAEAHQSH